MVGQIGPLVQVGRKNVALAFHVLGGLTGGALLGVFLGFLGVVLAEIFGTGLDTAFAIVVPITLAYAGLTDAPDPRLLAVRAGPLPRDVRVGLRPRARRDDALRAPGRARRPDRSGSDREHGCGGRHQRRVRRGAGAGGRDLDLAGR